MNKIPTCKARVIRVLLMFSCLSLVSCKQAPPPDSGQIQKQGLEFLANNAKRNGVITTISGLEYEVLQEGQGLSPGPSDVVSVNYQGSLVSGKQFDQGKDVSFPVNQVIPGWTEALQLMKEGSRYRLFIPSELAYGEAGAGGLIPPNSALIFDVELVRVAKP